MVRSARLAWSFLFTLSMILAWILRDFAKPLLMKIPCTRRTMGRSVEGRVVQELRVAKPKGGKVPIPEHPHAPTARRDRQVLQQGLHAFG